MAINLVVRLAKMEKDVPVTLVLPEGYAQGAEIALRFIQNYFVDGYGHLGDVDAR